MNIPLIDLKSQYKKVDRQVLRKLKEILSEQRLIMGSTLQPWKKAYQVLRRPHAMTCANGTDALILSLMALGIKEGDEVVTTPILFFATVSSIALLARNRSLRTWTLIS